jgi:hypothetical protein
MLKDVYDDDDDDDVLTPSSTRKYPADVCGQVSYLQLISGSSYFPYAVRTVLYYHTTATSRLPAGAA